MKEVLTEIAISKIKEVEKEIIEESYLYYFYSDKVLNESKFRDAKNKILSDADLKKIKAAANKKKMIGIEQVCNIALWAKDKFKNKWVKGTGITLGAILALYAASGEYFNSGEDNFENAKKVYMQMVNTGKGDQTTVRFITDEDNQEHMINFLTPEAANDFDEEVERQSKQGKKEPKEEKALESLSQDDQSFQYFMEQLPDNLDDIQ